MSNLFDITASMTSPSEVYEFEFSVKEDEECFRVVRDGSAVVSIPWSELYNIEYDNTTNMVTLGYVDNNKNNVLRIKANPFEITSSMKERLSINDNSLSNEFPIIKILISEMDGSTHIVNYFKNKNSTTIGRKEFHNNYVKIYDNIYLHKNILRRYTQYGVQWIPYLIPSDGNESKIHASIPIQSTKFGTCEFLYSNNKYIIYKDDTILEMHYLNFSNMITDSRWFSITISPRTGTERNHTITCFNKADYDSIMSRV